jgi:glucosyl-3-phosphoglycerate synthase
MARPLLARFAPALTGVIQPLGGEYAATRQLLESLPFAGGYGVEIGLLMDTVTSRGLDAIGQVDLGVRKHRNRGLDDLGVMAQQVLATVLHRAGVDPEPVPVELVQYEIRREPGSAPPRWLPTVRQVAPGDRPPIRSLHLGRDREMSVSRGTILP